MLLQVVSREKRASCNPFKEAILVHRFLNTLLENGFKTFLMGSKNGQLPYLVSFFPCSTCPFYFLLDNDSVTCNSLLIWSRIWLISFRPWFVLAICRLKLKHFDFRNTTTTNSIVQKQPDTDRSFWSSFLFCQRHTVQRLFQHAKENNTSGVAKSKWTPAAWNTKGPDNLCLMDTSSPAIEISMSR